ncbi:MAG: hypothetical protein A2Y10_15885 [Planctomycetes bacterium GWF2_41_51]|nr:MAG: hypothetical protein A2Y10_15885 [Planctomycetes bacterium GWF2_41_51]HBG27587.1 hypothetical protein [Phycisphaerales bacterium]
MTERLAIKELSCNNGEFLLKSPCSFGVRWRKHPLPFVGEGITEVYGYGVLTTDCLIRLKPEYRKNLRLNFNYFIEKNGHEN